MFGGTGAFNFGGAPAAAPAATPAFGSAFGASTAPATQPQQQGAFSFGGAAPQQPQTPAFGGGGLFGGGASGAPSTPSAPLFGAAAAPSQPGAFMSFGGTAQQTQPQQQQQTGAIGAPSNPFGSTSFNMFGGGGAAATPAPSGLNFFNTGTLAGAQPQQAQHQAGALGLLTKTGAPVSHATKWDDLTPDAQNKLLALEDVLRRNRTAALQLDSEERLKDRAAQLSTQAATTESTVARLREDMSRLSECFSSDGDAVATFRASVLQALHAAESAVEAYDRARMRTMARGEVLQGAGGGVQGMQQQQQQQQFQAQQQQQQQQQQFGGGTPVGGGVTPVFAGQGTPGFQSQASGTTTPAGGAGGGAAVGGAAQGGGGGMTGDVRARLAATGRRMHPSSVLVDSVSKAEDSATRFAAQVAQLEAVLLRPQGTRDGASGGDAPGALRASLHDTHAYLLSVAAAVSAAHDKVDAAKRACVAARKAALGAGASGLDPFRSADEDVAREAEAARQHPQPAFATSPLAPGHTAQQQNTVGNGGVYGGTQQAAPAWGAAAAPQMTSFQQAPAASPGAFPGAAPSPAVAPPSPVPFPGYQAATPGPAMGTMPAFGAAGGGFGTPAQGGGGKRAAVPAGSAGGGTAQRTRSMGRR